MSGIVEHMGMDRLKARAPEWLKAMWEGTRRAPGCVAIAGTTGRLCRQPRLPGSDKCRHHLRGKKRDAVDAARLARAVRKLQTTTNGVFRRNAVNVIRNVERRRLHRAWKVDPRLPGSTLSLSAGMKRIRAWLREEHHVDLDKAETTCAGDRYMTPRCIDRLRWGAVLAVTKRIDAEAARRRVMVALRDDAKFWDKLDDAARVP